MPTAHADRRDLFVRLVQRLRPVRGLPVWARYALTAVIVLLCFGARYLLTEVQGSPFLLFLPAVVLASLLFDRGSGFFATLLSTALAIYFFIEPRSTFVLQDIGSIIAVLAFLGVGLFTAAIIEALRISVDELVGSEEQLSSSLTLLQGIIEGAPDPIFVKDLEGRYVQANSVTARIFGLPAEVLRGRRDRDLMPEDLAAAIEAVDRRVIETQVPSVIEELINVAGEGQRCFLSTKAPWYDAGGRVVGLIGIARDIHERKQAERDAHGASEQKDLFLREAVHRFKNDMTIIVALLRSQGRQLQEGGAKTALANTANRVLVMSRVHERLRLGRGAEAEVDTQEFITALADDLKAALLDLRPVAIDVQVEAHPLSHDRAVAVGLIINEALTNALKYAFPDERAGTVGITFRREADGFFLRIQDDGVGFAPERGEDAGGVGRRLVQAMAQQIGGRLTVEPDAGQPGTVVTVRFPVSADRG